MVSMRIDGCWCWTSEENRIRVVVRNLPVFDYRKNHPDGLPVGTDPEKHELQTEEHEADYCD